MRIDRALGASIIFACMVPWAMGAHAARSTAPADTVQQLRESGDLAGARVLAEYHLERNLAARALRREYARILIADGWFDPAIIFLSEHLEEIPGDLEAWLLLGEAQLGRGDLATAVAATERAVELDPWSAPAWYQLGELMRIGGKVDLAAAFYDKARTLDRGHGDADARAELLASDDDATVLRMHRKWPGLVWLTLGAADVLERQGNPVEAIAILQTALEDHPADGRLHYAVGRLLIGVPEEAEHAVYALTRASELQPEDPETWYALGVAYLALEVDHGADAWFAFDRAGELVVGDADWAERLLAGRRAVAEVP